MLKVAAASGIISTYLSANALASLVTRDTARRKTQFSLSRLGARYLLGLLGAKVRVYGRGFLTNKSPVGRLIVCNHLSYLDIPFIFSQVQTVFITSVEVQKTPLLGQLASLGGAIFVERRNKDNLAQEVKSITKTLLAGHDVLLFAEGTSSNGEQVLPFKVSMFEAAIQAKAPVLPLTLSYQKYNGQMVSKKNRDKLFWYDDMTFGSHFVNLFKNTRSIETELKVFSPIFPTSSCTRISLAQEAFASISRYYQPVVEPSKG